MAMSNKTTNDMLLAIFKYKHSLTTLMEQGWYHIPVESAPVSFKTARWLCFYQGKVFGEDAYRVEFYGEISGYKIVPYRELFPNLIGSSKSDWPYYKIRLKELKRLPKLIPSHRPRRLSFIPTTWAKFCSATQINDLFNDSPLENLMWVEMKGLDINAERQWLLPIEKHHLYLDFAIFCNDGFIDLETDGDTWHLQKDRIKFDNNRNNQLAQKGWHVLRYNGAEIRSNMGHCVSEVQRTITTLGGLSDEGLVPRKFIKNGNRVIQQLSMFESKGDYQLRNESYDSGAGVNLEN
jgi:very-short-patch-repair endonuclease